MRKYIDIINENNSSREINLDDFVMGYTNTMLWSSTDLGDDGDDTSLDSNYDEGDISEESMAQINKDCQEFIDITGEYITDDNYIGRSDGSSIESRAGHDFWLTRCGHGAGFWDGDWKDHELLTSTSKKFGNLDPYVGDDGKIHID